MIESRESISADYAPGAVEIIRQHDGSLLKLRKIGGHFDPTDKLAVMSYLQERQAAGEIITGLLYLDSEAKDLHQRYQTVSTPLNHLSDAELCPGSAALKSINSALR